MKTANEYETNTNTQQTPPVGLGESVFPLIAQAYAAEMRFDYPNACNILNRTLDTLYPGDRRQNGR